MQRMMKALGGLFKRKENPHQRWLQAHAALDPFGVNERVRDLANAMHNVDDEESEKIWRPLLEASRKGRDPLEKTSAHRGSGGIRYRLADPVPFVLRMDANRNHSRPHIHLDCGREHHIASYAIDSGKRLAGTAKYDKPVKIWIEENRELLSEIWRLTRDGPQPEALISEIRTRPFPAR